MFMENIPGKNPFDLSLERSTTAPTPWKILYDAHDINGSVIC